ncbi:MAG TPA: endonuclease/exonuclease/phosphatase family protein [Anaeromyxobacter sp.]
MRLRRLGAILVATTVTLAACGDGELPAAAPPPAGPSSLRVMTQNLYLGGDLFLFLAPGASLAETMDTVWASVQATDFEARARVLADGIQAADPDVVGLQEVSLWRTQTPGDHLLAPNATNVAYDFLEILLRELASRGLSYRTVGTVTNGDVELPGTTGTDYRLTDRDAIIAKTSLPIASAGSGTYPHVATLQLPSPLPGAPPIQTPIPRGWVAADLRAGGRTIRLFATHLEALSADVATDQVPDLLAVASPTRQPTLVVGDMNLPPGSPGYDRFVAPETGLRDTWTEAQGSDPGLTCCWNPDLRGGAYSTRIDLVFATEPLHATRATRVNDSARTPGGLAPSDHAGVVVTIDPSGAASTTVAAAGR